MEGWKLSSEGEIDNLLQPEGLEAIYRKRLSLVATNTRGERVAPFGQDKCRLRSTQVVMQR